MPFERRSIRCGRVSLGSNRFHHIKRGGALAIVPLWTIGLRTITTFT